MSYQKTLKALSSGELTALRNFCSEINDRFVLRDDSTVTIPDLPPELLPCPEKVEDFSDSRLYQEKQAFLQRAEFVKFLQDNKVVERHDREDGNIKLWLNRNVWEQLYKQLRLEMTVMTCPPKTDPVVKLV